MYFFREKTPAFSHHVLLRIADHHHHYSTFDGDINTSQDMGQLVCLVIYLLHLV